jgi:hypothetical protein
MRVATAYRTRSRNHGLAPALVKLIQGQQTRWVRFDERGYSAAAMRTRMTTTGPDPRIRREIILSGLRPAIDPSSDPDFPRWDGRHGITTDGRVIRLTPGQRLAMDDLIFDNASDMRFLEHGELVGAPRRPKPRPPEIFYGPIDWSTSAGRRLQARLDGFTYV